MSDHDVSDPIESEAPSQSGALIPRATIEQIVGHRNRAVALFTEAFDAIALASAKVREATEEAHRAAPGVNAFYNGHEPEVAEFHKAVRLPDRDRYLRTAVRLIDINVWNWVVQYTNLERLMDHEAKQTLRRQMEYVPEPARRRDEVATKDEIERSMPPVTVENIKATLERFAGDADMIFKRGVANAFSKLDRRFRSHDGFKVGSRIVLWYAFDSWGSLSYDGGFRDTLIDIERAVAVLDGDLVGGYSAALGRLEQTRRGLSGPRQSFTDTEYFRIRGYKNGNAHFWFNRDDLVEKVNLLLADYYGEVVGDGRSAEDDPLAAKKMTPAKYYGFYPTPDTLVRTVIGNVRLCRTKDEPRIRVLEPSAGTGNLALACFPDTKARRDSHARPDDYIWDPVVDCIEIQPHLAQTLRTHHHLHNVYCADFLKVSPKNTGFYDWVIMNPPFDRERDIDHVTHALDFLQPNGTLVAIVSAGTEFRQSKKSQAFRALIERMGGAFNDLPSGSFSSVGTNINTLLLRVNKNGTRVSRYWK